MNLEERVQFTISVLHEYMQNTSLLSTEYSYFRKLKFQYLTQVKQLYENKTIKGTSCDYRIINIITGEDTLYVTLEYAGHSRIGGLALDQLQHFGVLK